MLDGHFCLLTNSNQVEKIEVDIFRRIGIAGVIILKEEEDIIRKRLFQRDGILHTLDTLVKLQQAEIRHARYVTNELNIPIYLKSGMFNSFEEDIFLYKEFVMKALLDTNIIIHRETQRVCRDDIGHLFRWLEKLRYEKCIHPLTKQELQKHADKTIVKSFSIKLDSYNELKTEAPIHSRVKTNKRSI